MADLGTAVPKQVELQLPPWLWGGNPKEFLAQAQLRPRHLGDNRWMVQTQERHLGRRPQLVQAEMIVDTGSRRHNYDLLQRIAEKEPLNTSGIQAIIRAQLDQTHQRSRRGDLADRTYLWQLLTMAASPEDLAGMVRDIHQQITDFEPNPGDGRQFPNAAVHVISRSASLVHRARLVPVLLRLSYDDDLRQGRTEAARRHLSAGELVFASGNGLNHGVLLLDVYLGPMLGCLSPNLWAFSASRSMGSILYSFGRSVAGTRPGLAEMLDTLTNGPTEKTWSEQTVAVDAYASAARWWTERLNDLFSILTDPAVFSDPNSEYDPARHHHALMTVEQLFQRVGSIQASHRDGHAARALLMTVLDTAMRLNGFSVKQMTTLAWAQRRLKLIEAEMPAGAGAVLLPNAHRGLAALHTLQQGFFMHTTAADGTRLVDGMTLEDAAASYIDLLRNATHGHGAKKRSERNRTNALLAHHNGTVPHDLVYLGYLYLLDLLCNLSVLRTRLHRER